MNNPTRRALLRAAGGLIAAAVVPGRGGSAWAATVVEIHMRSDRAGGVVGFDPVGMLVAPGTTVRWVCDANVHTSAAYAPRNMNHSQRIPLAARPWASDFLLPGQHFEVTLMVEGVYDYYCMPHEQAGMVGRLIVGRPSGPGTLPFDYFRDKGEHWLPVPAAAQKTFPRIADILASRVIRSSLDFSR